MAADGFLNLLKPPGMTSHYAVSWLRRLTGVVAGHAGTLDRAAAGVLAVCVGRARRLNRWAVEGAKSYIAEITFGITTDTLDAEGTVAAEVDASRLTAAQVANALARFEGDIEQVAPAYSAVHAGGVRLHQLARQGLAVPRRTRRVRIIEARLLDFDGVAVGGSRNETLPGACAPGQDGACRPATRDPRHPRARIAVECSKGTYIRSLAADVGAALGCGAYLSFLVRTRSGVFDIADSLTIEETQEAVDRGRFERILRPMDEPLASLPAANLAAREAHLVEHGSTVRLGESPASPGAIRMYGPGGMFLGIGEVRGDELRPRIVLTG
jgi:tRNA pseudouridine55 synthase